MRRRDFLIKTGTFLAGTFLGLNHFSKAHASAANAKGPCFSYPNIALIIDDIGFSASRAREFLDLGVPITYSVLPRLPRSLDLALEIHEMGHEVMLHQPMEPYDTNIDPGPGALYVEYDTHRIAGIVEENLEIIPNIHGVNNHMGSRFTEYERKMRTVLGILKDRGLFFVDSLTSSHSAAFRTARALNMNAARRNIFLDNQVEEDAILRQLHRLKKIALRYGCAVGIGHPFPQTAKAIDRFLKTLEASGISLAYMSNLICSA
ncbi:MAG: divergent polysaccharide deacetylase family protein [Deltaproteobacteria bacterium]|nr:divergent polysaccharide deacetylase family protein [Deltaproteobacteria bacterium]